MADIDRVDQLMGEASMTDWMEQGDDVYRRGRALVIPVAYVALYGAFNPDTFDSAVVTGEGQDKIEVIHEEYATGRNKKPYTNEVRVTGSRAHRMISDKDKEKAVIPGGGITEYRYLSSKSDMPEGGINRIFTFDQEGYLRFPIFSRKNNRDRFTNLYDITLDTVRILASKNVEGNLLYNKLDNLGPLSAQRGPRYPKNSLIPATLNAKEFGRHLTRLENKLTT